MSWADNKKCPHAFVKALEFYCFGKIHSRGAAFDTSLINLARMIAEIAMQRVHCFKPSFSGRMQ